MTTCQCGHGLDQHSHREGALTIVGGCHVAGCRCDFPEAPDEVWPGLFGINPVKGQVIGTDWARLGADRTVVVEISQADIDEAIRLGDACACNHSRDQHINGKMCRRCRCLGYNQKVTVLR